MSRNFVTDCTAFLQIVLVVIVAYQIIECCFELLVNHEFVSTALLFVFAVITAHSCLGTYKKFRALQIESATACY